MCSRGARKTPARSAGPRRSGQRGSRGPRESGLNDGTVEAATLERRTTAVGENSGVRQARHQEYVVDIRSV